VKKTIFIGLLFFSLIYQGCEDDKDTSPPYASIIFPEESSPVSEIITIKCEASDNDSVKFVELWIDSLSTGIKDSSNPYEFLWNTVPYPDSTEHLLMVKAEDMSNNISFSTSVSVLVDNSNSYPQSLNIKTITYNQTEMTVTINPTLDEDFLNYKILTSDNIDSQKYPLATLTNISDTIVKIYDFNPVEPSWYWLEVEDIHGYKSVGDGYFILDEPPSESIMRSIKFVDSLIVINWTPNTDNDFKSYKLFESTSSNMVSSQNIFDTEDISVTIFNHQTILNQYRYYQVFTEDYWGLSTSSNIKRGCSWFIFSNTYNDASFDYGRYLIQTNDDGYLVAGNTSLLGDNYSNVLMLKVDHTGEQVWRKDYTYSSNDRVNTVIELEDGSLVMAGFSTSNTNSSKDLLIMRTDSEGNIEWQSLYGDTRDEIANSISSASDGGFIIAGEITNENTGNSSCYLLKVNNNGEFEWDRSFGGSLNDQGFFLISANDGGFVITGVTRSQNDSSGDLWLIKVNNTGEILWEKTFGGENFESGRSLQQTSDEGYIIVGQTESFGNGNNDAYLLKTDSQGNEIWSRTYGGSGTDQGRYVVETLDQGYIISGYTDSYGSMGGFNFWLIKTDSNGDLEWQEYYGGSGDDRAFCGIQASDGGYAIVGQSNTGGSTGVDILLVKTDDIGNADPSQ
tara:strand:- start:591 stop:2624 length:2034 start_codon:yes stop_codon:yes gene_type:complete